MAFEVLLCVGGGADGKRWEVDTRSGRFAVSLPKLFYPDDLGSPEAATQPAAPQQTYVVETIRFPDRRTLSIARAEYLSLFDAVELLLKRYAEGRG